jgi:processive 1,2-diacylglycerol beta-glucosyltransferase
MTMGTKKILLLYISEVSGHHCASIAIEKALHRLDPDAKTLNINSFNYTNPILEKVINRTYMGVVRRTPDIWDYLYDNPKVLKKVQSLRAMMHRFNTGKLKNLLDESRPDAIICTQAFPCGMVADYKKSFGLDTPLIGVLTDYAPHSYWIYDNVDKYIVPSEETGKKLLDNGVEASRIAPYGIPIDAKFAEDSDRSATCRRLGLDEYTPTVLVMGGSQGLGPIKELIRLMERSFLNIQIIVATGSNRKLYRRLNRRMSHLRKKIIVLPDAPNIDELMAISTMIITKPGGITTAEALAKGLPMLIVHPLPGQEAMNTKYLLKEGVAVKAESPEDAVVLLEELLYNKYKLRRMSEKARALARPESALNIARLALHLIDR